MSAPVITAVIIGAGIFAPSPVFAECGSYIVYTDPSHRSVDEKPMMEHKAPVPCHGPGCSQVPPPAPMPPAPPTLRILVDDPLIGSSDKSLVLPSSDRIVVDSTDGEVVRRPADIFHPPR